MSLSNTHRSIDGVGCVTLKSRLSPRIICVTHIDLRFVMFVCYRRGAVVYLNNKHKVEYFVSLA